ncbi:MAG: helix-turn-helix domain-containing protein [Candidatus Binataceae bacterium]
MARELPAEFTTSPTEGELRLLDLHEAAELTGVAYALLYGEIAAGRLGACRVRGRWRVTRRQLAAWLKRIEKPAAES